MRGAIERVKTFSFFGEQAVTQCWHVAYLEDRVHSVDVNVEKCGHGWFWKCLWGIEDTTGGAKQNYV